MPRYEFQCDHCDSKTEQDFKMDECPPHIPCMACKLGIAMKIMSAPMIQCDDGVNVPWLNEAATNASNDHRHGRKRIETRTEYNQYLAANGLRPCSSGINVDEV